MRDEDSASNKNNSSIEPVNHPFPLKTGLEFLWNTHQYTNEYIRFADTKAGAVIALASSLLVGMYTTRLHLLFLVVAPKEWGFQAWSCVLAFSFLFLAIIFSAWSIAPRLWNKQNPGYVFWGSILAHGNSNNFWVAFQNQNEHTLAEHLAHHLFSIASVSASKYTWLKISLFLTIFGGLLGAMLILFH